MCALVTGVQTCVLPILVSISYGPLALEYILATGGSGYFRQGFVRPYLEEGRLALVPDSPESSYSAYVVHSTKADRGVLDRIRAGLKSAAAVAAWVPTHLPSLAMPMTGPPATCDLTAITKTSLRP